MDVRTRRNPEGPGGEPGKTRAVCAVEKIRVSPGIQGLGRLRIHCRSYLHGMAPQVGVVNCQHPF